jgi:flagellar FliJ protein
MKPFSMQPVLRYRKQLEDEARQAFFASQEKERELADRVLRLQDNLNRLRMELGQLQKQGTTVDVLLLYENRIALEQEMLQGLREDLDRQHEQVKRRRKRLLHTRQEKKALEQLKKKQDLAYKQYRDRQEAAMLDEIAVLRHNRP